MFVLNYENKDKAMKTYHCKWAYVSIHAIGDIFLHKSVKKLIRGEDIY